MQSVVSQLLSHIGVPESLGTSMVTLSASVPRYIPEIHAGHLSDFGEVGRRLGKQIIAIAGTVFASLGAGQLALYLLGGVLSGTALSIAAAAVTLIVFLYLLGHWVLPAAGRTSRGIGDMFRQFMSGVESAE
jgi:hypothetical protein